jgi:hypothetical protein
MELLLSKGLYEKRYSSLLMYVDCVVSNENGDNSGKSGIKAGGIACAAATRLVFCFGSSGGNSLLPVGHYAIDICGMYLEGASGTPECMSWAKAGPLEFLLRDRSPSRPNFALIATIAELMVLSNAKRVLAPPSQEQDEPGFGKTSRASRIYLFGSFKLLFFLSRTPGSPSMNSTPAFLSRRGGPSTMRAALAWLLEIKPRWNIVCGQTI